MTDRRSLFEHRHRWLTGTALLLHRYSVLLKGKLTSDFKEGIVAIGVVTKGGNNWLSGIQIDNDDAKYLLQDFHSFLLISREQSYIAAFRALVDYFSDLAADIAANKPDKMPVALREKAIKRRINAALFPAELRRLGIKLAQSEIRKFDLIRSCRNALEHNRRLVNAEMSRHGGNGDIGEKIEIDSDQLRETLLFVRSLAILVENRAAAAGLI